MWWSDRRAVLTGLGALMLAGCGFRPAYGPGGTGAALQGRVQGRDPESRAEFQFLAAFEERLGRPVRPFYLLAYEIAVRPLPGGRIQGIGATRIALSGTLDYRLDAPAGPGAIATVAEGQVTAEAVYSTTANQLAAQTAEEDAQVRLMRMLADALADRLLADPRLTPPA